MSERAPVDGPLPTPTELEQFFAGELAQGSDAWRRIMEDFERNPDGVVGQFFDRRAAEELQAADRLWDRIWEGQLSPVREQFQARMKQSLLAQESEREPSA